MPGLIGSDIHSKPSYVYGYGNAARLPRRGSYIGQALKFAFVITMMGFLLAVLIQFGYWLTVNLQQIRSAQ